MKVSDETAPLLQYEYSAPDSDLSVEGSEKKLSVGLCLMVWNELKGCQHDIPKLPMDCFDEVFALDGGSTDGTIDYLVRRGIAVVRQSRRGYDWAYIEAFQRTTCDALIVFHPKGSVDPGSLRDIIAPLREGFDLVIASRNSKGARNEEDSQILKPRKWFVLALSAVAAAVWWRGDGPVVWDVLHGYRAMRRRAFCTMEPVAHSMSMDLQMVVRSYKLGLKRIEVPICEEPRLAGVTHFKALPTGLKLLSYIWMEFKRGKARPEARRSTA
jgi:hypothetical protein